VDNTGSDPAFASVVLWIPKSASVLARTWVRASARKSVFAAAGVVDEAAAGVPDDVAGVPDDVAGVPEEAAGVPDEATPGEAAAGVRREAAVGVLGGAAAGVSGSREVVCGASPMSVRTFAISLTK
jgi:hypothetical protein